MPKKQKTRTTGRGLLYRLAGARWLKGLFPISLKQRARQCLQHFFPLDVYESYRWEAKDEYANAEKLSSYPAKADVRLGIIKEFSRLHGYYIAACRELGVPYRLVDISGQDWVEQIKNSGCEAFLVRPSVNTTASKRIYDERFKVMVEELGKIIYPSYNELWIYESKRRMHYWLEANRVPHPKTWIFYVRHEALEFARTTELPIVCKADHGAGSLGVRIIRRRSTLLRLVNRCFQKGFIATGADIRDRQWGSLLFQEYLPYAREWRMIRIGDSYFGYEKLKVGDFHSGSHSWSYSKPPSELLDFLKDVTNKGNFLSMDLDVFITSDGRYLVSELQALFGMGNPYEMCVVDDKPGRMLYEAKSGSWRFEAGSFCQNYLCNLRVEALLKKLNKPLET